MINENPNINDPLANMNEEEKQIINKAKELLIRKQITEKELADIIIELSYIPRIDNFPMNNNLFSESSFELFKSSNINSVFLRNLINIISILNYTWVASDAQISLFHNTILQIGLTFAFTFRNGIDTKDGVDYILLAPLNHAIYDYVSENGEKSFLNPNSFNIDKRYFNYNSIENINGDIYQENTISKLVSEIGEDNITICPKIMYYLEHEFSKKLFEMKIFDQPQNYPNMNYIQRKFNGYNEIDMSFVLKEKKIIKENNRMNIIKLKNSNCIERSFNINQPKDIVLDKNTNIFIEMKYSIYELDLSEELNQLCKKALRFSQAYKNAAYQKTNNLFAQNNISYIFLYNNSRNNICNFLDQTLNNEVDIYYNSPSVEISSLASLEKKIRKMGNKLNEMENEIKAIKQDNEEKMNEIKEIMKEELRKNKLEVELGFAKKDLQRYTMDEAKIKNVLSKAKENNRISDLDYLKYHYVPFQNCAKCYSDLNNNDEMIILFKRIIGKKLKNDNEMNDYRRFIDLLNVKKNINNDAAQFYDAFKHMLLGKYNEEIKDYNIFFGEYNLCIILNEILSFILFMENNNDIKYYFYAAMLCLVKEFNEINNKYGDAILTFLKKDNNKVEDLVIFIIESINSDNLHINLI